MRKQVSVVITAAILILVLANLSMAANPFLGTWKLNGAKSKAGILSGSETLKNMVEGGNIKTILDGVDSKGKVSHSEWLGLWNGNDYPITGATGGTVAIKRVHAKTISMVVKDAITVKGTYQCTISKDGKELTLAEKGKKGKAGNVIAVFDKQ
jgi:hypothetical protein